MTTYEIEYAGRIEQYIRENVIPSAAEESNWVCISTQLLEAE